MKSYSSESNWFEYKKDITVNNKLNIFVHGEILTDDLMECGYDYDTPFNVRIRTIAYEGHIYYYKTVDGEVMEFKELI